MSPISESAVTNLRVMLVISNLEFGGAQRQVIELANELSRQNVDVFICSLSEYIPLAAHCELSAEKVVVLRKRTKYDSTVPIRLAKKLLALKIDVVHGYLFDAEIAVRIAGALARTPLVIGSERNSDYHIKRNQQIAYSLTKRFRHACVANSQRGAEFNAAALGYLPDHYDVVLNGVSTSRFRQMDRQECRKRIGVRGDTFLIGMFASFKPQKNHPMLLKALAKIGHATSNAHALLVGDMLFGAAQETDQYRQQILDMIRDLGLENATHISGNVDNVESYYAACDVTVLPSWFEGTPNVVLESMACGVPVIATDVSSNDQIIANGEDGYLIPLSDDREFVDRIVELHNDPEKRRNFGTAARKKIEEKFSTKVMADNMLSVYLRRLGRTSQ